MNSRVDKRLDLSSMGWAGIACLAGLVIPFYAASLGNGLVALGALPALLILITLFLADRKVLLLVILVTRSLADGPLESARASLSEQGPGFGAVINGLAILLTITLVLENPKALSKKMALAWLGFFLTGLYGIALSPQKADAVRLYLAWVSNFCVFTAAFYVVKNERDFIFCLRLILWASVGPSLYMLYEIFMNVDAVASGGFRVKSSFTHPNIFAFFLMLVIIILPYLISRAQTESSPWRRSILVLYMLVLVAGIGLTQTRSAWLACAAVFVCYGIIFRRRYLFYILSIAILCLFVPVIRDRLVDLGSGNEIYTEQAKLNSFAWRVALWESALFWMEPVRYLLGYGIGAFREYAPVFFARSDGIHWDAHNVYVQWFFDVGILGLCCYVWIHVRTIFTLRHLLAMDRSIAFTIIAIVLSYMLISFSDNMMFYLAFNWYYWFAVGAACALVHATVMVPKSRLDSKSS